MFEIYRARTGYPTRRKKLARDLVHVAATFEDGSTGFLDVPITDYPQMLLLPTFPTARALCGLGHDRGVAIDLGTWGWSDSEQIESFKSKYGLSGFTAVEVDPMKFSRFLARIAFAGAIVRLGPDAFTSIGIDNILGLDPSMNFYVGSGDLVDMAWPEAKLPTHQFKHFFHPDTGVVMMALRLFAHLDPPTYHVIVGHQAGGGIAKIMEQLPPFRKETQHPFPFQVHVNK